MSDSPNWAICDHDKTIRTRAGETVCFWCGHLVEEGNNE